MFTPYVGTTYAFEFTNNFATLNGIYTVLRVMTYDEMLEDSVDLRELYTAVGLTEADLEPQVQLFRADKILKLSSIVNSTIWYIPHPLLNTEPDPNVREYYQLLLALDLGYYEQVKDIEYIKSVINDIAEKGLGLQSNPSDLFSHNSKWMTEIEYNELKDERDTNKQTIINLFSENNRLRDELERVNNLVIKYEQTIVNTQKP